jgi:hypothetical protein
MPTNQPFTFLCQQLARSPYVGRADLHLHTTASDGTYTPDQIVDLARRCGLATIAITDHDTFAGIEPAQKAAAGSALEIVTGVEITTEYRDRELHLLGYFIDPKNQELTTALTRIRHSRVERFAAMIERLRGLGVSVEMDGVRADALGRRHLAELLVQQGKAGSIREAFQRWLADGGRVAVPKRRLDVGTAIDLVRQAGGVASLAHPVYDGNTSERLAELSRLGLDAVEVEYPTFSRSQREALRHQARLLGLVVTGGSDCHGPGKRGVGSCTISTEEFAQLRKRRGEVCSAPCSTRSNKA